MGREAGFAVALQAICVFLSKVEVSIGPNAKQQGASELIHSENLLVGMHKVYYLILQVVSFGFDVDIYVCIMRTLQATQLLSFSMVCYTVVHWVGMLVTHETLRTDVCMDINSDLSTQSAF